MSDKMKAKANSVESSKGEFYFLMSDGKSNLGMQRMVSWRQESKSLLKCTVVIKQHNFDTYNYETISEFTIDVKVNHDAIIKLGVDNREIQQDLLDAIADADSEFAAQKPMVK